MRQQDPLENKAIKTLEALTKTFASPTESLDDIYAKQIKPIVDSPFMFNSYHWVTDISKQRLMYVENVQKILGYDHGQFTLEKSVQIIHPNYQSFVVEYGLMAYKMLKEPQYQRLSPYSHYCIQYPIKHAKGHYLLVQMDASVVQVDEKGNPIANYNRFEVLGYFLDVPIIIRPRVYFRTNHYDYLSNLARQAEEELSRHVKESLLKKLGFSEKEQEVMILSLAGLTNAQIAEKRNVDIETIKTQNKNILMKARKCLSPTFRDAYSVASYLRKIEII